MRVNVLGPIWHMIMHLIRDRNLVFSLIPIKGGTRNIRRFFGHTILYIYVYVYTYKKINGVITVCSLVRSRLFSTLDVIYSECN